MSYETSKHFSLPTVPKAWETQIKLIRKDSLKGAKSRLTDIKLNLFYNTGMT